MKHTALIASLSTGLGILFGSVLYPNKSVVTLTDIGEDRVALFCLADRPACCRESDTGTSGRGTWLLPGKTPVVQKSGAVTDMFYRSIGTSVVILHRDSATLGPSGVFTCNIPDSADLPQQVFVGIYPPDAGIVTKHLILVCIITL